ncbi:MAG: terpene cyclase/mutase family protein [Planctomycetes bacterium]|nr:terpene cyclase/mutase family protein [Planctomycetota bacterium]
MKCSLYCAVVLSGTTLLFAGLPSASSAEQKRDAAAEQTVGPDKDRLQTVRQKAVDFLKTTQADDGSWTSPNAPGITGLCATALLRSGLKSDDSAVAKALAHLESHIKPDGGVYFEKSNHRNYETCIAILAFLEADAKKYAERIKAAEKFLRNLQWDEGEGLESTDTAYGGAGYGSHSRPDLSNTQFLVEALKATGAAADDPALQKALVFVSRTQNLETEHNTTPFAAKIDDGGFYYTPAAGGTSQAGTTPEGGLRSYGSMTYAGLKSMIYAGLNSKDPRVKAAFEWIRRFYTLEQNPGLGQQGLYYYYHTFAKALDALELDYLTDARDRKHDWRKELTAQLQELQQENGSWVNSADRWYEGDPNLATAYSLMALSYCEPKAVSEKDATSEAAK